MDDFNACYIFLTMSVPNACAPEGGKSQFNKGLFMSMLFEEAKDHGYILEMKNITVIHIAVVDRFGGLTGPEGDPGDVCAWKQATRGVDMQHGSITAQVKLEFGATDIPLNQTCAQHVKSVIRSLNTSLVDAGAPFHQSLRPHGQFITVTPVEACKMLPDAPFKDVSTTLRETLAASTATVNQCDSSVVDRLHDLKLVQHEMVSAIRQGLDWTEFDQQYRDTARSVLQVAQHSTTTLLQCKKEEDKAVAALARTLSACDRKTYARATDAAFIEQGSDAIKHRWPPQALPSERCTALKLLQEETIVGIVSAKDLVAARRASRGENGGHT
ncbi:hypothetical protein DIPPA_02041 [Diplonema papillatum]|nr:hypothetical protein DIPPA_02041 [Diplonema papillatum]